MSALTDALDEVREALLAGEDPDAAIVKIATAYGLKPPFLKNRAVAALGDVDAYKAKGDAATKAMAQTRQQTLEKIELKQLEEKIARHNASLQHMPDFVPEERLTLLVARANELLVGDQYYQNGVQVWKMSPEEAKRCGLHDDQTPWHRESRWN
ncbi:hypothetical protein FZC33_00230 [Labrys sp. KNU-23]|uniref:hypothetical protein n=1 Tax=Labrys sp. KNU-23 TaxID=2789216 RepID=UPI0011ED71EB|nr:hypothetical protein [Labrys sp. KNU-23]QEN84756.1 hypothetical protein FZC33_00230 [Labrys sp. KNU-23]